MKNTKEKGKAGGKSKAQSRGLKNSFAKGSQVKFEDLSSKDVVIGVMGPTGTGKSTFIEIATGLKGIVGHGLKSCTNEISPIKFQLFDTSICLVDTPGFDDTNKSDVDIFRMISDWLNDTYKRDIPLAGLLYFHRISDNRMAGTPLKNLRLFEKICGKEFSTIILTTTMWDEIEPDVGEQREQELKDIYWKSMIDRGSTVNRFSCTRASAFDVLRPILTRANEHQSLLLQREMTDLGMQLRQTAAGRKLASQLEELVLRQKKLLTAIRNDLLDPTLRPEQLQQLQQDYQEVSAMLQHVMKDMEKLKISAGEGLLSLVGMKNWKGIHNLFRFKKRQRHKAFMSSKVIDQIVADTGRTETEESAVLNSEISGCETDSADAEIDTESEA